MAITQKLFGHKDGKPVTMFTLENNTGFQISCIDYGCIITGILAPDRTGKMENVVLGFDSVEEYEKDVHFLGAVVGRFAGRIQKGEFELNGHSFQVGRNSNGHHLHGGASGFNTAVWKAAVVESDDSDIVEFTLSSPDGEEGYPGNVEMKVRYKLEHNSNKLKISYSGITDQATLLNVTNHSYFNLSGNLERDVLDHELILASQEFLELDEELLPTGKLLPVSGSVFDLRSGRAIREAVESDHAQAELAGGGYDHPFLLDSAAGTPISLRDAESGRQLTIETTEPAVVVYTGNGLDGPYTIRGTEARNHLGMCLETQKLPDSMRHPHFGSSVLEPGEEFASETSYSFEVVE